MMLQRGRRADRILDSLVTAVIVCDPELRVSEINPAGELLFGVSAKQACGRPLASLVFGSPEVLMTPVHKARANNHPITVHDVIMELHTGRTVTVDFSVTPVDTSDSSVVLELVQVDRFLRLAREDNRAGSHAANRAVLRGIAHEIKNPLGGLRGAAQLLDRELPDRSYREYTRIIIHEADRLRNLVDRMMGSYKPMNPRPVNVHAVLEHVRLLIQAEVPDGISFERDYDPSLPEIPGEHEQLIQVVLNIVRNAVEAMSGQGIIRISTRIVRSIYIGQRWHRQVVRVDIEDNGPGIPQELREKIFYPMVTGRAEGSGLGLSIAQDVVDRHGGMIQVDSVPGATCFSLYLPLTPAGDSHVT